MYTKPFNFPGGAIEMAGGVIRNGGDKVRLITNTPDGVIKLVRQAY